MVLYKQKRGDLLASLGEKLKNIRELRGMGQKEVSELTGISYKTISNYENDRSEPDVQKLALLCQVYNVTADFFIPTNIPSEPSKSLQQKTTPDPGDSESEAEIEKLATVLYEGLLSVGFIEEGQDLTSSQIDFLDGLVAIISAFFDKGN